MDMYMYMFQGTMNVHCITIIIGFFSYPISSAVLDTFIRVYTKLIHVVCSKSPTTSIASIHRPSCVLVLRKGRKIL
jgi:hypothetical protein